jgi:ribonuclease PH
MPRSDSRLPDQLRPVRVTPRFQSHPSGSVLIEVGRTRVICAASVTPGVPGWMRAQKVEGGWLTCEYAMLPSATSQRKDREVTKGRPEGRTQEIQRLIGRSLRAVVDLTTFGANTIYIDCDVIDADGGTRCASITGAAIALQLAFRRMFMDGLIKKLPTVPLVAAVSVGLVKGEPLLDLCYEEDSAADVDMNVVMTEAGNLIELQGTAERATFTRAQSNQLLDLAEGGLKQLFAIQRQALS